VRRPRARAIMSVAAAEPSALPHGLPLWPECKALDSLAVRAAIHPRSTWPLVSVPTTSYYRTRRKARCPIGTGRHMSPGRWVSTRACASCSMRGAQLTSSQKYARARPKETRLSRGGRWCRSQQTNKQTAQRARRRTHTRQTDTRQTRTNGKDHQPGKRTNVRESRVSERASGRSSHLSQP
jgi:hypothetical protein